jgi:hypothetical protein
LSFLDSFFGTAQKRDIQAAHTNATAALDTGLANARTDYTGAIDRLNPYAETGSGANAMYANALGVNGRGPQQTAVDNFMADPFRAQNEQLANENLARQFNGRAGPGMGSGAFALAAARGNLERGTQDYQNYLTRLAGLGTQGAQVTGQQSGIQGQLGQTEYDAGNTRAGNEINYGNAMAASRGIGVNNLLGLAGTVIKGFTPGWGGPSAFGSMAGATPNATSTPFGNITNAATNGWNAMRNWATPSPAYTGVGAYPY